MRWTDDVISRLEQLKDTNSRQEIADILSREFNQTCTKSAVQAQISKLNAPKKKSVAENKNGKPADIASDPFKSAKWDELTQGRNFSKKDVPTLKLLCMWYQVIDKCMNDLVVSGDIQVAYSNAVDDIKELPQINTMKKASAEIRALSKQLHIEDEEQPQVVERQTFANTPLALIQGKYKDGGRVVNG